LLVAKGVPESAIEAYRDLQNSVQQLGKISKIQKPEDKFLIVSLDFHTPRVKIIAQNQKLSAEHQSAEKLLQQRSPHYKKPVEKWAASEGMDKARKMEAILLPLNRVDTKGYIQTVLTKILGTRKPLTEFPLQRKKK